MKMSAWLATLLLLVPWPLGAAQPASPWPKSSCTSRETALLTWHYELLADESHATLYHPAALRALRRAFKPQ